MTSLRRSRGTYATAFALTCVLVACDAPVADTTPEVERSQQLVRAALADDEIALDDGLVARIDPAREQTDGFRSVTLIAAPDELELVGTRVFDARRVEGGVVTLGLDHVLRLHVGDDVRALDTEVTPPLSVEAGRIAYARGFPPDLRLTVVDLDREGTTTLLPELMPVWSPALSPDGREVIFAASPNGEPELLRVSADGQVREVESSGRTPSSPIAPRWTGRYLTFHDEYGVARLDLETGLVEELGESR